MARFIPIFEDDSDYLKNRYRSEIWLPAIEHICKEHGLPADEPRQIKDGSHVIFAVGREHGVKISPDAPDEIVMREQLQGRPCVEIPHTIASGEPDEWPFFAMSRVGGSRLDTIWPDLTAENGRTLVCDLTQLILSLQRVPTDAFGDLERYPIIDAGDPKLLLDRLRQHGDPAHLIAQVSAYLKTAALLYPAGTDPGTFRHSARTSVLPSSGWCVADNGHG